jgi:hypothetical protein
MYEIIGIYNGQKEVIDSAESLTDANYLVTEYKMAFGSDWTIYKKRV